MQLTEQTYFGEGNRYYLEKLLGRGGFSEVWLVKDTLTDTKEALSGFGCLKVDTYIIVNYFRGSIACRSRHPLSRQSECTAAGGEGGEEGSNQIKRCGSGLSDGVLDWVRMCEKVVLCHLKSVVK